MNEHEIIRQSFPFEIREEIDSLLAKFSIEAEHASIGFDAVLAGQATIQMPLRIYYEPPYSLLDSRYTITEIEILNCIFSRHHNGFIRQQAVQNIISSDKYWVTPYLVRIAGEYVIEILCDIYNNFDKINKPNLISFIVQNPNFYERTCSQITSYWDCYYRRQFPEKLKGVKVTKEQRYVGFQLLDKITELISKN